MKALRRTVFWQSGAVILCGLVSWVAAGSVAGISSLLGGLVCALPSMLVVLLMHLFRNQQAHPLAIFLYEFIKVSLVILGFFSVALAAIYFVSWNSFTKSYFCFGKQEIIEGINESWQARLLSIFSTI